MGKTVTFNVGGPYITKSVSVPPETFPQEVIKGLCKDAGIVEYVWFGLEFTAPDGMRTGLNNADQIGALKEELEHSRAKVELVLLYYPTSHTVVLQPVIKEHMMNDSLRKVLDETIYAPPDIVLNLLAHWLQVNNGDCENIPEDKMVQMISSAVNDKISKDVKGRHSFQQSEWEASIQKMWKSLRGIHRLDVIDAFLEEVEKLQMHNIHYFVITNTKKSSIYVGVEATGLSIYPLDDKQTPMISFEWIELSSMEYKGSSLVLILKEKANAGENTKLVFCTSGKYQGYRIGSAVRGFYDNYRNYLSKVGAKYQAMKEEATKLADASKAQRQKEIAEMVERTKTMIAKSIEETKETDQMAAKRVENVVNKLISVSNEQDTSQELYEKLKDINKSATKTVSEETKKTIRMSRTTETASDTVYEQQEKNQFTKFQTLAKLRVGNTRTRVEQFESL